jgi:uncharacterized protein (DUF488 family)
MNGSSQTTKALFTVGHSNHDLERFVKLISRHEVSCVVDVRSVPYSQRCPQFNRDILENLLPKQRIRYLFLGEELGARRCETECYVEGKARYELIAKTYRFRSGIEYVERAAATERLALMCAETDPITCHRAILVCRHLRENSIQHILPGGQLENHAEMERRMLRLFDLDHGTLFEDVDASIEKAYALQGERIAYVDTGTRFEDSQIQEAHDDPALHDWVHEKKGGDVFHSPS